MLLFTMVGNHTIFKQLSNKSVVTTGLSDTCCMKALIILYSLQRSEQNFKHHRTFMMGMNNACTCLWVVNALHSSQ